jgi:hypothetical protein
MSWVSMCQTAVRMECSRATIAFFLPRRGETVVAGTEVGDVLGAGGGHRGGTQRSGQPSVAVPGLAGFAFAGGLVVPRADTGPGGQVPGGAKAGHVGAGLGDDDLGGGLTDPGDGGQLLKLAGNRRICSSIRVESSRIAAESWSMRSRCRRHRKPWWSPKFRSAGRACHDNCVSHGWTKID